MSGKFWITDENYLIDSALKIIPYFGYDFFYMK